jgi:iron(III) transport system substrate-binding protein
VSIIFPNQGEGDRGAHINISGGGIAKYSKNRDAAIQFLEFLVSLKAQELYAKINYEYPVIQGVALPHTLTVWGEFKEDTIPIEQIAETSLEAQMIVDRARW